jgi:hypothetical protein
LLKQQAIKSTKHQLGTTKKTAILDGFKPSRNANKPSGINSRRFKTVSENAEMIDVLRMMVELKSFLFFFSYQKENS